MEKCTEFDVAIL